MTPCTIYGYVRACVNVVLMNPVCAAWNEWMIINGEGCEMKWS